MEGRWGAKEGAEKRRGAGEPAGRPIRLARTIPAASASRRETCRSPPRPLTGMVRCGVLEGGGGKGGGGLQERLCLFPSLRIRGRLYILAGGTRRRLPEGGEGGTP